MYIVIVIGLILAALLAREWVLYRKRARQVAAVAAVPKVVVSSGIYRSHSPRPPQTRTRDLLTDIPILSSTTDDRYPPTVVVLDKDTRWYHNSHVEECGGSDGGGDGD